MMSEDPIIDEIHDVRRQIAAEFEDDVHAFFDFLRQGAARRANVVTLDPVAPDAPPADKPRQTRQ
jgi:hypothetical protein